MPLPGPELLGTSPTGAGGAGGAGVGPPVSSLREELRDDMKRQRKAVTAALTRRSVSGMGRSADDDRRPTLMEPFLATTTSTTAAAAAPSAAQPALSTPAALAALFLTPLNILLLGLPLTLVAHAQSWGPIPVFSLSFLSLIPLASLLAVLTEELAAQVGDTAGGLLNATAGNIPELAVSISALRRGLFDVVTTSLLGSITSNLLLVLGCCHVAGAIGPGGAACAGRLARHGKLAVKAYSSMLVLACAALAVPTATAHIPHDHLRPGGALAVSRGVSVLLLLMYAAFLVFSLGTHARPLEAEAAAAAAASAAEAGGTATVAAEEEEEEEEDLLHLPLPVALACLLAVTAVVGLASELLTGAIRGVAAAGVPQRLLSLIIIPVAANATEHASSVIVAAKGKMDLAHSIALGSSLQVATFVMPACVVAAWAMGIPFDLACDPLLFLLLLLSVLHQQSVSADGRSDWLTGTQLICLYVIVAIPSAFMKVSPTT